MKLSSGKVSLPDAKRVFLFSEARNLHHDIIALRDENVNAAEPLLKTVMADSRVTAPLPSLREIRERCQSEFTAPDEKYRAIRDPDIYPVHLSPGLQHLKESLEQELAAAEVGEEPVRYRPRDLGES
jgi:hypothetical protein